jgi:hypothetical protein
MAWRICTSSPKQAKPKKARGKKKAGGDEERFIRGAAQGRPLEGVLIYVVDQPSAKPETDEQKQRRTPFALYAECGAVFPQDDGDEYLSLCLRARPDHATEIRQVFAGSPGGPTFAVIDAIGGGVSWPQLRAILRVESGREILAALLAPSASQTDRPEGAGRLGARGARLPPSPPWA